MDYKGLRRKYPKFVYQNYSWRVGKEGLEISFDFRTEPDICFRSNLLIEGVKNWQIKRVGKRVLDNLIFHLGMIEGINYWKATCSPTIEVRTGYLNYQQRRWWKKLIFKGMGQYFYENKINFLESNFLKINCLPQEGKRTGCIFSSRLKPRFLVAVGGGKDSVISLELLKELKRNLRCFSLNPVKPAKRIIASSGCKKPIFVKREIDPLLLELNQRGFLNGHTPFSAFLAFLGVLLGILFDYKFIVFSNERSAEEGNLIYLGKAINHQWSKTLEFEECFRKYSKRYLAKALEYFSILRPLYEIQIGKIFSCYPKYFPLFLSCNVAFQTDSGRKKAVGRWCGNCPKCLFIFAILYPFLERRKLIKIFGEDLFEKKKLLPLMNKLIGKKEPKPFECVGTKKEALVAFYLACKKSKKKLPFLLRRFKKTILPQYSDLEKVSKKIMSSWSNQNNLPKCLEKAVKSAIKKLLRTNQ